MWYIIRSASRKGRSVPKGWTLRVEKISHCGYLCNDFENRCEGTPKAEFDSSREDSVIKSSRDEYDEYGDDYEPKTAREKVWYYSTIAIRLGLLSAAVLCFGMFIKEVFPGRMGANFLFSEVHEFLKINDDIREITGAPMKAYGRDVGRNEGRRNHVDSHLYDVDGGKRMRVRFMVEGPRGKVKVWAEVSDKMLLNEFVYIICQDMQTGRVITIVDDREKLRVENTKFSDSSRNFMNALLRKN